MIEGCSNAMAMVSPSYSCAIGTFFLPTLFILTITLFFLPLSSVSLSYITLSVPMHKCLGEHKCTSSSFLIAMLNVTAFLCSKTVLVLTEALPIKN